MSLDKSPASFSGAVNSFYQPPPWVTGHISPEDADFLHRIVTELRPNVLIEIGVASGCSSAVILHAMHGIGRGRLVSYDIATRCYFDERHMVGAAVAEMKTPGMDRWQLHCGKALDAARVFDGQDVPLAFIDANHAHPWPTLDALALLPAMAPDGWYVLHDINLPQIYKTGGFRQYGAQFLHDGWPGEKRRSGGTQDNIGAIRLLGEINRSRAALVELLSIPWETKVHESVCPAVMGVTTWPRREAQLATRLARLQRTSRDIVLWGAGSAGQTLSKSLRDGGIAISWVVDRNPEKHGQSLDGAPIKPPASLTSGPRDGLGPFVVVASMYFREITASLIGMGFSPERDFAVADVA